MLECKSAEITIRNRVIGSIIAYMRGTQGINWAISIFKDEKYGKPSKETMINAFNTLRPHYVTNPCFQQLESKCIEEGLF